MVTSSCRCEMEVGRHHTNIIEIIKQHYKIMEEITKAEDCVHCRGRGLMVINKVDRKEGDKWTEEVICDRCDWATNNPY